MIRTIAGDRFDSTLDLGSVEDGHHANLYVELRVCLQKFEPPPGKAYLRYTRTAGGTSSNIVMVHWPAGSEWADYCRRFEHDAEEFFHGKLWLVPDGNWIGARPASGSGGRSLAVPAVRCGFRLRRVPIAGSHLICDVAYTTSQSEFFRSAHRPTSGLEEIGNVLRVDGDPENLSTLYRACYGGNHRLNLTQRDLDPVTRVRLNTSFQQRVFLHELGHALGLGHVNAAGTDGSTDAYGVTVHQSYDLMGRGERISPWHATPWIRRIARHLRDVEAPRRWTATATRPPVRTERVYGGSSTSPGTGGVAPASLDGGVAAYCPTRGGGGRGPAGMVA